MQSNQQEEEEEYDCPIARELYELSATQGNVNAQYSLGRLYANGEGVEQSNETAREWWMKSAEQGEENAIKALQILDKHEGRTTPSFTPPQRCSTCDAPKTSTHKLRNCKCKGAQYCNAKCQTAHWKSHQKEHRRLCKEMKLKNTKSEMMDEVVEVEEAVERKAATATADSQQHEEEEDVCPVCIEALQKDDAKYVRMTCCGKGIHMWCFEGIQVSSMSDKQKSSCPLCRAKHPKMKESIKQLRLWVEKGKAWAQCGLGDRYANGQGVGQSDEQARELWTLAARQGDTTAQHNLGVL